MGKSKAVSAQYRNECKQCGAAPLEPCRTLRTGRVTDTHMIRIEEQFDLPVPEIEIDLNVRTTNNRTWTIIGQHQWPGDRLEEDMKVIAIEPESGIRIPAEVHLISPYDNEHIYVELRVDWEKATGE